MSEIYLALGALCLGIATVDLLWTTLWVEGGAGPLTSRFMAGAWTVVRRAGARSPRLRTLSGPLILVLGLSMWILLLWAGWTLVFASAENALRDTVDGRAITWVDLIYVTGYTMFTLGNGDFVPWGDRWQLLTTLVTGSGMLFVTLTVTYVLSVLGAVTQKRAFASGVSGLGSSGGGIVRVSWNGEAFRGLSVSLNTLTAELNTLTANHKAYPIIHYFHSGRSEQAPATSVAVLDEALTLLEFGIRDPAGVDDLVVQNARASVENYLRTIQEGFVEPADRSPPPPDLQALSQAEIQTVSVERFRRSITDLDERRRTLLGLVESDAREWPSAENA